MSRFTALIIALAIGSLPMLACSGGGLGPPPEADVTLATVESSATPAVGDSPIATMQPVWTPPAGAPPLPLSGPPQVFSLPAGSAPPVTDFVVGTPGAGGQLQILTGTPSAGGSFQAAVPFTGSVPGGPGAAPQGMMLGPTSPGLAQFLGISTEQLDTELKQPGATQASIAAKYGKSRDALKTFMLSQQRNTLDQAVRSGNMPKALADQFLLQYITDIDKLVDQAPGAGPVIIGPGQAVPAPR